MSNKLRKSSVDMHATWFDLEKPHMLFPSSGIISNRTRYPAETWTYPVIFFAIGRIHRSDNDNCFHRWSVRNSAIYVCKHWCISVRLVPLDPVYLSENRKKIPSYQTTIRKLSTRWQSESNMAYLHQLTRVKCQIRFGNNLKFWTLLFFKIISKFSKRCGWTTDNLGKVLIFFNLFYCAKTIKSNKT